MEGEDGVLKRGEGGREGGRGSCFICVHGNGTFRAFPLSPSSPPFFVVAFFQVLISPLTRVHDTQVKNWKWVLVGIILDTKVLTLLKERVRAPGGRRGKGKKGRGELISVDSICTHASFEVCLLSLFV
jgi:hypothetical protein